MDENKKIKLEGFKNLNIYEEIYTKKEMLGINSFSEQIEVLNNSLKFLIDDCIKIILSDTYIPERLVDILIRYIDEVQSILNDMVNYKFATDVQNNMNTRREIITRVNNLINQTYSQHDRPNNFLQAFSAIKSFSNDAISDVIKNANFKVDEKIIELDKLKKTIPESIDNFKSDFADFQKEGNEVLKALQEKASEDAVSNYSKIFKDQAEKHSSKNYKFYQWSKRGAAEKWLLLSVFLILVLIIFLIVSYSAFPILEKNYLQNQITQTDTTKNEAQTPSIQLVKNNTGDFNLSNLILKVSILTVLFFLIKFCVKQYSINKHLFTLNKHRENTLNSYKLFISSIGTENADIRNTLMLEVAKAIYENSKTGYISEKDGDVSSPSIVELTRMVSGKN